MTDKTEIGRAYHEWVTGLDTEPPLDGAFSGGWHARGAEIERLTRDLVERDEAIARLMDANGSLTRDLEAAQQDQRYLDESVRNQAMRETIHKEELKRLQAELEAARQQIAELELLLRNNVARREEVEDEHGKRLRERDDARARLAAAEQLRNAVKKHYPSIAGHAIRLHDAGEDRAGMEWADVAKDFNTALTAFDAATVGQEQGGGTQP